MRIDFGHTLNDLVTALEPMLPKKSRKETPMEEVWYSTNGFVFNFVM
jgi:hypothetical protein